MRRLAACLAIIVLAPALRAQAPAGAPPQWRAFWVDGFNPGVKSPEQVSQLVADLKALHMNAVVVQMRKRGDALFRRSVEPFAAESGIPAGFDPLDDLLAKAHKEGIQVHAWINVGTIWPSRQPLEQAPAAHIIRSHGPGATGRDLWLTQDELGRNRYETGYNADPGHPDYQSHYVRVVTELVKTYPVDGIHFDYVRYPELTEQAELPKAVGYNPTSVERFNRLHGRTGLPDNNDPLWKAWRRQQVTQLVRRVRVELLEARPQALLSGALIPWGDGPGGDEAGWYRSAPYIRVFQDWHAWRQEGLLDLIVPMNYDREARPDQKQFYDHWIQFEKAFRYRAQSVVGVGAYLNSVPDTLAQVRRALAPTGGIAGADGICLYNYASFRRGREGATLDDLRKALVVERGLDGTEPPFAKPAPAPTIPRLTRPTEGVLAGIATDAAGRPLDSQPIVIEPATGGLAVQALTDGNGFFAAVALSPGRYRVAVPINGVAKPEVVEVAAGAVTRVGQKGR